MLYSLMRRIFTLLCCIVIAAQFSTASAQKVMQIWKDGKVIATYETSAVDSVNFADKPYKLVDLGLPSGILWSETNVGATLPADTGDFYAWGETSTKKDYSYETSVWYGKEYTKDTILVAEDDVATQVCGSAYRMPRSDDFNELFENCESVWTTQTNSEGKDQTGYLFKGKNGNTIFLPAAGYYIGTEYANAGVRGNYWTSEPDCAQGFSKYMAYIIRGDASTGDYLRSNGCPVRPVSQP